MDQSFLKIDTDSERISSPTIEMAKAHWQWVKSVLLQQIEVAGKMYVDAFVHGYGHGQEDLAKIQEDLAKVKGVQTWTGKS